MRLNAKIVPFAGWEMPISYPTGIVQEYHAVRSKMGLFDVSHMGQIEIRGPHALQLVQRVSCNDVSKLKPGKIQYSAILNEQGGIIDDCTVYCFSDQNYLVVVNASCVTQIYAWIINHKGTLDAKVIDRSEDYTLLALQGPLANQFLSTQIKRNLDTIKYYEFNMCEILGANVLVSRTGYTGEDGFELYIPIDWGQQIWDYLLQTGESEGLLPIGLGARDLLRLDMGYLLSGQDFNHETHVLEAGLSWIAKLDKGAFIGRDAVLDKKEKGLKRRLRGFMLESKGIARNGYEVHLKEGNHDAIGYVTSGNFSPSVKSGIGLAYVPANLKIGDPIAIDVRGRLLEAKIVKPPFIESRVKK